MSKMNINALPDGNGYAVLPREALIPRKGGFNISVSYFSVSKKGDCTELAVSRQCTYAGDSPSKVPSLPAGIPRLLEKVSRSGNGGYDSYRLFA